MTKRRAAYGARLFLVEGKGLAVLRDIERRASELARDVRSLAVVWRNDPHASATLQMMIGDLEAVRANARMLARGADDPAAQWRLEEGR